MPEGREALNSSVTCVVPSTWRLFLQREPATFPHKPRTWYFPPSWTSVQAAELPSGVGQGPSLVESQMEKSKKQAETTCKQKGVGVPIKFHVLFYFF